MQQQSIYLRNTRNFIADNMVQVDINKQYSLGNIINVMNKDDNIKNRLSWKYINKQPKIYNSINNYTINNINYINNSNKYIASSSLNDRQYSKKYIQTKKNTNKISAHNNQYIGLFKGKNNGILLNKCINSMVAHTQNKQNNRKYTNKMAKFVSIDTQIQQKYAVKQQNNRSQKQLHSFQWQSKYNQSQMIPLQCLTSLKQIHHHLKILKTYGFSQQKITKWMYSFLSKHCNNILHIFLKSQQNKKSLNYTMTYEWNKTLDNNIKLFKQHCTNLDQSQQFYVCNQLRQFKLYIEGIVVEKTKANLEELFNIGVGGIEQDVRGFNGIYKINTDNDVNMHTNLPKTTNKLLCKNITAVSQLKSPKNEIPITKPLQIVHFMKDLKTIQERYGQLTAITKFNRIMFKQISQAQHKFVQKFFAQIEI